jgi:hypothetical protein
VSPRHAHGALPLAVATLEGGCWKEEPVPREDRPLAKLRGEVDRVNRGGAPTAAPGAAPAAKLDLDVAHVKDAEGQSYGIARDAQALAGTRQLARAWQPGERSELVLVFEVPPSAVRGPGLTLVLPATGGDVQLTLR